jgi:hypothetical protein
MMSRKTFFAIGSILLLLAFGTLTVLGQGDEEQHPIVTTASNTVGVGTYVAAEAYGVAAGEDPAEAPASAIIMPYGIYPDMKVMSPEAFVQPEAAVEGFTFEWSLAVPDGSSAILIQDGVVAIFMADVVGMYDLTLVATDPNGNVGEVTWRVYSTTYVGSGYLDGAESAEDQCIDCHEDVAEHWSATGHGDNFILAINGEYSDHFSGECLSCHTTGYNDMETAVNGGFDDLAAEANWSWPETMEAGNWEAMVEEFPAVAGLANVQCEACHGPGDAHVFEATRRESMISRGLEYGVCAQCHAEEPYNLIPQQWENSAHSDKNARAFWYPIGEDHASCVRCHSGAGYIDWANGLPTEEQRTSYATITCAVCHSPHSAANPNQLRVFDSVLLPDGTEVADAGAAATCMSCHNARTNAVAVVEGAAAGERFSTPHYSTAGELMNATGGYTWGEVLPTSTHGNVIESACVGCHMAEHTGMEMEDDMAMAGHYDIGGHSFAMTSPDGVENVGVCQECHDGAASFEFEAFRDYDGDGEFESNQAEVAGLIELLQGALEAQGVAVLNSYPYFEIPEDADVNIYGAVYNFKFTRDDASAVHNLRYTVALLQLSYEQLTGEPVPGAYILSPK